MKTLRTAWTLIALVTSAWAVAATAAEPPRGKVVFDRWCAGCHFGKNRMGGLPAGTYALEQRYKGAVPADLLSRTDMKPEFIKGIVRGGVNVMPRTRKTEISDADLDLLIAYINSAAH
jgi:mono/diheme cytochrome c family protein